MDTPNDFSYLSAPASPTSVCSLDFYSAPTSPTSEASHSLHGFITGAATSFLSDTDFEFDTSCRFLGGYVSEPENPTKSDETGLFRLNSAPSMAFADELFCDGKVVPLAPPPGNLKLPPGFGNESGSGETVIEPRSPRSVIGNPFSRPCLWNDDFDPFVTALENVKEGEDQEGNLEGKHGSRVRPSEYYMGLLKLQNAVEAGFNPNRSGKSIRSFSARLTSALKLWAEDEKSPNHETGQKSPKQERTGPTSPAKPKGVVFARRVRMAREKLNERRAKSENGPIRRQKSLMRLLFRGSSERVGESKGQKHEIGALWKPTFLRRLSLRSNGKGLYNKDKKIVSRAAKMTLIQYRSRLSLCMGYGP